MAGLELAAAYSRKRDRRYASVLLVYWLSSTPVIAYDSVDMAQESPASYGATQHQQPHRIPVMSKSPFTARGILLSENNRTGYLTDSPYLSRRLSEDNKAAPRRHPATLPPVPRFNKPTPSLFGHSADESAPLAAMPSAPSFKSPPVVKAAKVAPVKAKPVKIIAKKKEVIHEAIPAPRIITEVLKKAPAPAPQPVAEAKKPLPDMKVMKQEVIRAPLPQEAAPKVALPKAPAMPMPVATTIESGLSLPNTVKQPEITAAPQLPRPKMTAMPDTTPQITKPATPIAFEVVKMDPVVSKGDKKYQPALAAQPKVNPASLAKMNATQDVKMPQHVLKMPANAIKTTSAEDTAKNILGMTGTIAPKDAPSIAPKMEPKSEPKLVAEAPKLVPKNQGLSVLIPQMNPAGMPQQSVPIPLMPKAAQAIALQQQQQEKEKKINQAKADAAKQIEDKLREAMEARGKLSAEPKHHTTAGLATELPSEMSDKPLSLDGALTTKPVTPKAVAKIQAAISALRKANAEHAAGVVTKQEKQLDAAEAGKAKAEAEALALREKLKQEAAARTAADARAKTQNKTITKAAENPAHFLKMPAAKTEVALPKQPTLTKAATKAEAPEANILTMPTLSAIAKTTARPATEQKMSEAKPVENLSEGDKALLDSAQNPQLEAPALPTKMTMPFAEKNPAPKAEMKEEIPNAATGGLVLPPMEELPSIKPQSYLLNDDPLTTKPLLAENEVFLPKKLLSSKELQEKTAQKIVEEQNIASVTPAYTSAPVVTHKDGETMSISATVQNLATELSEKMEKANADIASAASSAAEEALLMSAAKPLEHLSLAEDEAPTQSNAPVVIASPAPEKLMVEKVAITVEPKDSVMIPQASPEAEIKPQDLKKPNTLSFDDARVADAIPASPNGLLISMEAEPEKPAEVQVADASADGMIVPMKETKITHQIGGLPASLLPTPVPLPKAPEKTAAILPTDSSKRREVTAASSPIVSEKDNIKTISSPPFMVKHIPSAPLNRQDVMPEPMAVPLPRELEQDVAYETGLSTETKNVLAKLPTHLGAPLPLPNPEAPLKAAKGESETHEAQGVSIEMREPDFSAQTVMEEAYAAVMKGDTATAMDRYQMVLEAQPNNNEAKFGLATVYHRMGETAMARGLYSEIVSQESGNLEALNNLLVLISQESPQEALGELQQLELKNPQFSPIPAQMAAIYAKMGKMDYAIQCIQRAADLEPENLAYRYNAAVLLDRAGKREEAIKLYVELKRSYERGLDIPADMPAIQERLTFLLSNRG